jgi:UDP-N-acetylmuramate dehydrogenase
MKRTIDYTALNTLPETRLHLHEPLTKYTAARLGGPADAVLVVKSSTALGEAIRWAHEQNIPWVILGGGTNVLIADSGWRGLVVINHSNTTRLDTESGLVFAEAGANLSTLAQRCIAKGLQGLEWSVSVPGTLGGAVVNNAGAHGSDIAHNLQSIRLIDTTLTSQDWQILTWPVEKLDYDYRYSILKATPGRYIVLDAILHLKPNHDPQRLKAQAQEFIAHRKRTQPPGASLGSIFKNPPGDYAGRLIEACGLKGYRIGGVQVSPVHANFFVNDAHGTANEYHALINYVQAQVLAQTGVHLETEVECLGF